MAHIVAFDISHVAVTSPNAARDPLPESVRLADYDAAVPRTRGR